MATETAETWETWPGYREIPARLNITREVLDRRLDDGFGDRTAFVFEGGSISYAGLGARVNCLARGLSAMGIAKGARILVRLPNCLEFAVSFLALIKIGAVPIPVNTLLTADDYDYMLRDSRAPVLAVSTALWDRFETNIAKILTVRHVIQSGPGAGAPISSRCFRAATRTSKNSSRFVQEIQRNRSRSRSGVSLPRACSKTRLLNSSWLSSRFIYRSSGGNTGVSTKASDVARPFSISMTV